MYRGGNGSKLETGHLDWKRINDALDKHLEKSSPSTSRGMIGKDRGRLTVPSSSSGNHPEQRSLTKHKTSDGKVPTFGIVLWYLRISLLIMCSVSAYLVRFSHLCILLNLLFNQMHVLACSTEIICTCNGILFS